MFKGKGLNNADFEAAGDIAVGDEVVIYGTLKNYNGNTPEFDQGSFLLSKVRKPSPELAWSAASCTATYGQSIEYPTLTNPNSVTVTYSSSETNVATIDPSTGVITLKANGNTNIKASFAGDATYKAQEVSYTLTVTGMKAACGISFANAEVNMTYDEDYEGQELTNPNSLDVTYESSDDEVAEVDENTGVLALYKAGTVEITARFAGNATYAEGSASYTINVTKATAGLAFESVGPFKVAPDADFTVPTFTNPHNLTVNWSSTDEDVATADGDAAVIGSKLGSTVIKASFAGDDRYNEGEASYTIIVTNEVDTSWDLTKVDYASASADKVTWSKANLVTMTLEKGGSQSGANNYLGNSTNDHTRVYKDQVLTITPASGYAITSVVITAPSSSYASGYDGTTTNYEWSNASASKSGSKVTVKPVDGTKAFSVKISAAARITSVAVTLTTSFEATVSAAGYATFAVNAPLDFTGKEIKAYLGTIDGTKLTFTRTDKVPASTGMLLVKEGGATENIPLAESATGTSCLTGVLVQTTLDADDYILNVVGGEAGFYKAGTYTTLGAHKAYIAKATAGEVKSFAINFDDTATAVQVIKAVTGNEDVFNLAGQKVNKAQKGVFISNGRKFIVK